MNQDARQRATHMHGSVPGSLRTGPGRFGISRPTHASVISAELIVRRGRQSKHLPVRADARVQRTGPLFQPSLTKLNQTKQSGFFQEQFECMTVQINDDACVK